MDYSHVKSVNKIPGLNETNPLFKKMQKIKKENKMKESKKISENRGEFDATSNKIDKRYQKDIGASKSDKNTVYSSKNQKLVKETDE